MDQSQLKQKSLSQIMLMCLGFFGIQFGWALQMGNMSTIYARLGAKEEDIPLLWLAAPVTGLLRWPSGSKSPTNALKGSILTLTEVSKTQSQITAIHIAEACGIKTKAIAANIAPIKK